MSDLTTISRGPTELQVGDIVRISRQPHDLLVQVVGEVGYIEEIKGEHSVFVGLRRQGGLSGSGTVPLSCLDPEPDPLWPPLKAQHEAHVETLVAESRAFNQRLHEKEVELGTRYGIAPEAVQDIYKTISDMWSAYRY